MPNGITTTLLAGAAVLVAGGVGLPTIAAILTLALILEIALFVFAGLSAPGDNDGVG